MSGTGRWQTIEHTGDLAITLEASSLEGLFGTAAAALAAVLLGEEGGAWEAGDISYGGVVREVEVESPDRTALLVDWLRELLYLQMSEEAVLSGVEIGTVGEGRVKARVSLRSLREGRNIERELKAVTYHDAEIDRSEDGWTGRIVFDI